MKFILSILLGVFILVSGVAEAGRRPTPQERKDFTDQYFKMKSEGGQAFSDWAAKMSWGTEQEAEMYKNLADGKTADGHRKSKKELAEDQKRLDEMRAQKEKGFMGDPNDPGPQDWSDWDVQTDADGNVTGFTEKDFDAKDTDDDGKISDAERKAWDEQKKKEHEEAGGAPGEVDKPPSWDQDRDGKPDPGFELSCYQCKKSLTEPGCLDGDPGPCDSHACDQDQECFEHTEKYGARELICHNCGPKEEIISFCEDKGYMSDPACNGQCPPIACVPIDVDKDTGQIIGTNQTRVRGSTERCYTCMRIRYIEVTWVVIIIETPYERFVLGKGQKGAFEPMSVMALAKVDEASGMIKNTLGELKPITDFLGGFNVGLGPMGMTTTGKVSMDQLTSLLSSKLSSSGSATMNCFDDVVNQADEEAASQGSPTSKDIAGTGKERKNDKKKGESENTSEETLKKADQAGNPAVSGPIVACGNEDGNKVMKIYDASGSLVDTITQAMLKANPSIITEKLGFAQQLADGFIAKSGFDFAAYVQKFTGVPLKDIQGYAARVAQVKAQMDQVVGMAKASKKKKGEEPRIIIPNDPLYFSADALKPKSAVAERMKQVAANPLSTGMRMGGQMLGGGAITEEDEAMKRLDVKDQWGIRKVGYTDESDPNSAWNVIEANEQNVVVAVVDSGLDMTHPDIPQYIWTNPKEIPDNGIDDDQDGFVDDVHGWNFVNENHDFTDVRGHGTFVAGIIAAKYNNGVGIAGINPGAVIMPVKVADDEGVTNSLAIYRGINYAVNHGAKVINVSLGSRSISKLEQIAIERAHQMGVLVVMAGGNNNENIMNFGPASSRNGIAVGQIDYSGTRSTVSNWGANLALVAPGEQIYSLCSKDNKHVVESIRKSGYYKQDGTSFAAPMVAATASLIWAKNPVLTNQQVADMVLATATDMDAPGWDGLTGYGLLNAAAALRSEADEKLILMFTNIRVNRDIHNKVISLDVFGTVQGKFKEFSVEVGKGKRPGGYSAVAGPFNAAYHYQHIARINIQQSMRGSDEWVLRIKAVDEGGQERVASTPFTMSK